MCETNLGPNLCYKNMQKLLEALFIEWIESIVILTKTMDESVGWVVILWPALPVQVSLCFRCMANVNACIIQKV